MKKPYCSLSREELTALKKELEQEYRKVQLHRIIKKKKHDGSNTNGTKLSC